MKKLTMILLICLLISCTETKYELVKDGYIKEIKYINDYGAFHNVEKTIIYFKDNTIWILNYNANILGHHIYLYRRKGNFEGYEYIAYKKLEL